MNDVIHYTGMGTVGDQRIDATQNKTLSESRTNGVAVHLFEVFEDKDYTYVGEVYLCNEPYQEIQPDENDDIRIQRATCEFAYTNKSTLVNSSLVVTLPSFTARLFISPIRSFFCPRNRIGSTAKKTHLTLGPDKGGQQT